MGETLDEIAARVKAERRLRMRSKMRGIAVQSSPTVLPPASEATQNVVFHNNPSRNHQQSQSLAKSAASVSSGSLPPRETPVRSTGGNGETDSSNYKNRGTRGIDHKATGAVASTMMKEHSVRQQLHSESSARTSAPNDTSRDDPSLYDNSTLVGNSSNSQQDMHTNRPQHVYNTSANAHSTASDAVVHGGDNVQNNQTRNDYQYEQNQNYEQYQNYNRGYSQNYDPDAGRGYNNQNYNGQGYVQSYDRGNDNRQNYDRQGYTPQGYTQSYNQGYSNNKYDLQSSSSSLAAAASDFRYDSNVSREQTDRNTDHRDARARMPSSASMGYQTRPPRQSLPPQQQQEQIRNDPRGETAPPPQTSRGYDTRAPRAVPSSPQSYSRSQPEDPRSEQRQQPPPAQLQRQDYNNDPRDHSVQGSAVRSAKPKAVVRGYQTEPVKARGYQTEPVPKRGYQVDPPNVKKQQQQQHYQCSAEVTPKRPIETIDSEGRGAYGYYGGERQPDGSYGDPGRGYCDDGSASRHAPKRPRMENKSPLYENSNGSSLSEYGTSKKFRKGGKNGKNHRCMETQKNRKPPSPTMGKGRGRGMGMNKPSWMTEEQYMQQQLQQTPSLGLVGISHGEVPQKSISVGRGRGRGMVKPAWMTEEQFLTQQQPPEQSNSLEQTNESIPSASSRGESIAAVRPAQHQEQTKKSPSESIYGPAGDGNNDNGNHLHKSEGGSPIYGNKKQRDRYRRKGGGGRGRGGGNKAGRGDGASESTVARGRGRGMGTNKPAWMTDEQYQQQIQKHAITPVPSGDSHPGGHFGGNDDGLGRGRGRGRTLPAWMTK